MWTENHINYHKQLVMIVFGFAAESLFRNLTLLVEKMRGSYEKKKGFNV